MLASVAKAAQHAYPPQTGRIGESLESLRLYNFYRPSLQAGLYTIEAKQHVEGPPTKEGKPQTEEIVNVSKDGSFPLTQKFAVIAPQFSLDPKVINSYYPPDGHQDEGKILPHIVFSDPHVPWYRPAGTADWMLGPTDTGNPKDALKHSQKGRNIVPWIALMVFKADDLRVSTTEASALNLDKIKAGKRAASNLDGQAGQPVEENVYNESKQPASGAFAMNVGDYLSTITSRVYYDAGYNHNPEDLTELKTSSERTSIIFPIKSDVQKIFNAKNDLKGIQAQKLQAHVRQLNTLGFPDAGVEGNGYYSVVVSSMTGDLTTTAPTTHIVHLVSIEHLDSTLTDTSSSMWLTNNSDRIGMVSLFSWTYHCIPEAVNFEVMMTHLGEYAQPLRPPKEQMEALSKQSHGNDVSAQTAGKLFKRLNAGYTLARWRAPSGEESIAFNRGPLIPVLGPEVPCVDTSTSNAAWPPLSMSGRDYMIFDKSMGMHDATYASAWSLGKLVGISDSVFNAALMRFRSSVWNLSTSNLRKTVNNVDDWSKVLNDSINGVEKGQNLALGDFSGVPSRINKPANIPLALPVDHPSMADALASEIHSSVSKSASTPDGGLFNGFLLDSASNSDWEVVYHWIYDCLYLSHIPAHVLFPEPSHLKSYTPDPVPTGQSKLQQEALRFFHIDHAWLDCFIDGALSCANHVEPQYDNIRLKIKQIFNNVLSNNIGKLDKTPPVPRYGFVIRSAAVKATPDIKLIVRCWKRVPLKSPSPDNKFEWVTDPNYDPLVRHTKLDEYTILSLLDCIPEQISYIELAQPAHQQRFAFGVDIVHDENTHLVTKIEPEIDVIKIFTNAARAPPNDGDGKPPDPAALEPPDLEWKALSRTKLEDPEYYDSTTRCIDPIAITDAICTKLVDWGKEKGCFDESDSESKVRGVSSSSIFGLEMNDRAYHFKISGVQPPGSQEPFPSWIRQLWTGPKQAASTLHAQVTLPPPSPFVPVTLPKTSSSPAMVSPRTALNIARIIPVSKSPITSMTTSGAAKILLNPWASSGDPQFEMLIHPDYRPPPPKPLVPVVNDPSKTIFSPLDYLATETKYLYDLIFSIRRRNKGDAHRTLRALRIEIPISKSPDDDNEKLTQLGDKPREPLLRAGQSAQAGVRMAFNQRFVPSLFNGPASTIGDVRWDKQPVLGITLIPRSGQESGTMYLGTDDKASAIAVRLGECQLNPVVNEETVMAYMDPNPSGWKPRKVDGATKVRVKLTEEYGDNRMNAYSFCTVVKIRGKDQRFPEI